ncbi:MAG TPA: DUF1778 domain-containing protein, partial [Methylophaga sp.]|nr:DUF1778 domain-containing protein [Methylophaga sp.]
DFMLEAACREAENVLLDQHLFSLDEIQFEAFQEMLDAPLNDNNLIQALLVSVSPWEK